MPKKANTGIPGLHVEYESRCIECDADEDCDAGQYCYAFGGTCKDADNQWYICHEESATKFGTCHDKEDDVFGTSCGPQSCLAIWSESTPPYLTQNCFKQQLGEGANGNPNPNGYCGKLVYYNDSYVPHGPSFLPPAGFAMAKLWEGVCVAGKCAECDETATTNYGERAGVQCINGREVWARDNDWTIRTFTNNTIAGTALTGVVGIALILMCWCCFMVQVRVVCLVCHAARASAAASPHPLRSCCVAPITTVPQQEEGRVGLCPRQEPSVRHQGRRLYPVCHDHVLLLLLLLLDGIDAAVGIALVGLHVVLFKPATLLQLEHLPRSRACCTRCA